MNVPPILALVDVEDVGVSGVVGALKEPECRLLAATRNRAGGGPPGLRIACDTTLIGMELDDPNLPSSANRWLLATSDQVQALGIQWHDDPESANISDIVETLLAITESQARIIAALDLRIQHLEKS